MLTMAYRDQLQIKFHPTAFSTRNSAAEETNLPLELTSIKGKSMSLIASLVLQSLQHHLASTQQSKITPKQLLRFISSAWDRTTGLENEARMLEFCGLTRLTLSDPSDASLSLRARCTILGNAAVSSTPGRKGAASKNNNAKRIDVDFTVRTRIDTEAKDMEQIGSLDFDIDVIATKVYGFGAGNKSGLSGKEMQNILGKGMVRDEGQTLGNGVWCKAVQMLTGSVF
jgi:kinetochore protein Spc7/SPC105